MSTPLTDTEVRRRLGDDLHDLVRARGTIAGVTPISPLAAPTWKRAAYRIDLADGTALKGRRIESVAEASRLAQLHACLPNGPFPALVAHGGTALLEEWIDGAPVSDGDVPAHVAHAAGAILRSIHDATLPAGEVGPDRQYPPPNWRTRLAGRFDELVRRGALTAGEATRALETAVTHVPVSNRFVLVHGDLAPENLIVDAGGRVRVIDNDSLDVHAAEFDFARVWYRWPMSDSERYAFEQGYGEPEIAARFRHHLPHWVVVVLVGAALFRINHDLPDSRASLDRLRAVLGL